MEKTLLIIPLSYGYIHSRDALPVVEERTLESAARHYLEYSSRERRIVMSYTVGCPKEMPKKIGYLLRLGVQREHILISSIPLKNVITEGEAIRDVVIVAKLTAGIIILIAQEDCVTRAQYIFSKLFPEAVILVEKIVGGFERDIPYRFMRNQFIHKILNLVCYWGIRILGLERMKKYGHPEHKNK
ncbi:MAG: hypothetical protein HYY86_03900 [Candidatus Harrisonbacteria bacterium]|nr:hypothetical protein [Candidatus Harrisonbacteria bacterium]